MSKPVKVAFVGCGGISGQHLKGYADLHKRGWREMEYVACCDLNEAGAAARAKEVADIQGSEPKVFTDLNALIKSGVAEAADICLPHWPHHSVAVAALEAGLHVMVEKPIGITIKATRKIIEAGKKAGRVVATAEQIRRCPGSRAFRWAIAEKKMIGDIRTVHTMQIANSGLDFSKPQMKWRGVKLLTGGGMIMDSGAHYADMMMHILGDVDEVVCTTMNHDTRTIEDAPVVGTVKPDVETAWNAIIRFKSGVEAVWCYSRHFPGEPLKFARYYGSQGMIEDKGVVFHPFQGGGAVTLADGKQMPKEEVIKEYMATLSEDQKHQLFPLGCESPFGIQTWDFVQAIKTGRKPEVDGEGGLRAKTLCECCFESAATRKPVKYADVLSGKVCEHQKPIDEYWKI